jgi:diguanylate cyclase (GGDEF)-like protein
VDVFARYSGNEIFARIGGEEFALLLPGTKLEQAVIIAEHLRQAVSDLVIPIQALQLNCTLSIGVTMLKETDAGFSDCLRRADQALYSAKQNGRNRIEVKP